MTSHDEILIARNRTRRQYKAYAHEATLAMIGSLGGGVGLTRSETIEAVLLMVLRARGCDISYVPEETRLKIDELRGAITRLG